MLPRRATITASPCSWRRPHAWVWESRERSTSTRSAGSSAISAGHNHPRIKKRLRAWLDEDQPQHTTIFYLSEPIAEPRPSSPGSRPESLKRAFFTNSGSEANELAILLARQYTKRYEIIALKHAYHGGTTGTISLVGQHTWRWGGPGLPGILTPPNRTVTVAPGARARRAAASSARNDVEDTIKTTTAGEIAAFIAEPIQGVGGFVVPPKEYFPRVHEIVKKYGGIYISDEVQAGAGRTGKHWFARDFITDITPDMMTMAKGFGNGAAIGASDDHRRDR